MPFPVPVAPPVIVIHDTMLDAVRVHPGAAVTVSVPVPAPPPTEALRGEMVAAHEAVKANWLETVLRPTWLWLLTAVTRDS